MADLEDEGNDPISPMVGLGCPPRKRAKGNWHNPNREILEDPNQLAHNGW